MPWTGWPDQIFYNIKNDARTIITLLKKWEKFRTRVIDSNMFDKLI